MNVVFKDRFAHKIADRGVEQARGGIRFRTFTAQILSVTEGFDAGVFGELLGIENDAGK